MDTQTQKLGLYCRLVVLILMLYRRRSLLKIKLAIICVALYHQSLRRQARKVVLVRNVQPSPADTWEATIYPQYTEEDFLGGFHCTKETFEWLCRDIFGPYGFERSDKGPNKRIISLKRRVAVFLWRMCHGDSEWSIARRFLCGQSTVNGIVRHGLRIISDHWTDLYIKWPLGDKAREVSEKFEAYRGFPQVIASVGVSHLPIVTSSLHGVDYFNSKSFNSFLLMAAVDTDLYFLDVDVGISGCFDDARALAKSSVAQRAKEGMIDGQGYWVVANAAFNPPKSWLMCPYKDIDGQLTLAEHAFNEVLSGTRICVEHAFVMLKSRFRILLKRMESDLDTSVLMAGVCCVLHNMLLSRNEIADPRWIEEAQMMLGASKATLESKRQAEGSLDQELKEEVAITDAGLDEFMSSGLVPQAAFLGKSLNSLPDQDTENEEEDTCRAKEIRENLAACFLEKKRLRIN